MWKVENTEEQIFSYFKIKNKHFQGHSSRVSETTFLFLLIIPLLLSELEIHTANTVDTFNFW